MVRQATHAGAEGVLNVADRVKLLYILAPSFSGSTLLTYLLAHHPRISTIGELKATKMGNPAEYRCSCGDVITECRFWNEVGRLSRERSLPFDVRDFDTVLHFEGDSGFANRLIRADVRGPMFEAARSAAIALVPAARRRLANQLRRNYELTRVIAQAQGGEIFLDGSKDPTRLLHFIGAGLWDVRIVYLQRDGRGVISSIAKHRGIDFAQAAEQWERNIRALEHMRRRLPDRDVLDMKYEDLCSRPTECLTRLFNWLGIEDRPIEVGDFKQGSFHILGNSMRLNGVSAIKLDEAWRTKLSPQQIDYFLRKFGAMHSRLGYA
jgi:hypothetical protein